MTVTVLVAKPRSVYVPLLCLKIKVEVLTEERDVARSHEEELFALLTDKTEDLEALQESYVSLTDR